ncbi:MAG: adenylate/guanylate cyclase domain-containing protein, partial [Candidatus Eremiobacteraeota bacterium]|nr:adenylate/guanylate cyclase domain-containing protein [Candidatus Eremiobacteraeota bacterium]
LLPLLVALVLSSMRIALAIAVSAGVTLAYAYASIALFITKLYWLDLVHVTIAMLLCTIFVALYRVLLESSQRRLVTNVFGMHVSPAVVSHILSQDDPGGALALKGKRVKATIFYSDIRGFSTIAEHANPEDLYEQLNEYFEAMCAIVFAHGGFVDKFIGDCVMAVFSAPFQRPDDAACALRAAMAQQRKIAELSVKWGAEGKSHFTVGMGINTGEVVMGNLGARSRMNYTVVGDAVNLAARLYDVAKSGEIIISEDTYREVKTFIAATELAPVLVKGRSEPVRVYRVTGPLQPEPAIR